MKQIFFFFIAVFSAVSVSAQSLIPRRVLYQEENKSENSSAVLISEILNARINDYNNVIPVKEGEQHHNVIRIKYTDGKVFMVLEDISGIVDTRSFFLGHDISSIENICSSTAEYWKDYLKPAEPFIEDVIMKERRKLSQEAEFEESLSTPYQLTLWMTLIRNATSTYSGKSAFGVFFPNILSFDWFMFKTWGINLSFYEEHSEFMNLGYPYGSINTALLPGIGITFRSLGRISGSYGFTYYYGPLYIDVYDSSKFIVSKEEAMYPLMAVRTGISWNMNELWSFKLRFAAFVCPLVFSESDLDLTLDTGSAFHMDLLIGAGYRW